MGGFDAGALLFKIQSAGKAMFVRDMAETTQAIEGTERASRKAAASAEQLSASEEKVSRSAKSAKQGLDAQGKASQDLEQKTRRSSKATDEQGRASETAAQKTARLKKEQAEAARAAEEQAQAAKRLAGILTTVGVATAAMVGLAVAKNTEFDAAMSNVRAATMATISDQKRLGEAALEAGADTAYSAREAAEAEEELAKAGMTVSQIVGGSLNGSLALAAAGQLQVARSAEIMATSLIQFKLPAEQAGHVADVLAAGAGKAQGGVEDMALALSYVGPVASGLKISLEETAGGIALLASQGILGEKAGTALRGVLMSLTAPSNIASKAMQEYGIDIWDANGNMLSLAAVSEQLKQRLGGLTEAERSAALGRIFGNEQITAARVLYDGGAKAIDEWTRAVDDSGYAADQAAMRQDNLAGDVEKLGGAFDTALIRTGSGANDVLRDMVQTVTALVDWYGELPSEVQQTALVLGVATTAITLFAGAAVFLRVKFSELRAELKATNTSMRSTALIAGGVGLALTAVFAIVGQLAVKHAEAQAKAQSYADALKQGGDAATQSARELAIANLQASDSFLWMESDSAYDAAKKLGISLDLVTDAAMGNKDALAQVTAAMQLGANGSEEQRKKLEATGLSMSEYTLAAQTVKNALDSENSARDRAIELNSQETDVKSESTEASKTAADTYLEEAGAVSDLESQLRELISTMMEANGQNQDAISANAQWRESLGGIKDEVEDQKEAYKKANGSLRGYTQSLDESTASGAANAAMLAGVAADAQKAAEAQFDVDMATMSGEDAARKYADTLASQRAAFEKSAIAAGYNADEVRNLADRVFALPSKKEIDILANTGTAQSSINEVISRNNNRTITLNVKTNESQVRFSTGQTATSHADGGHVKFYADGGKSEDHVAQYARPGDWRVWAEPETGGEWYLPDGPHKRGRSLALASQMLDGWGYQLTPKGATAYASGGSRGTSRVSDTVVQMRKDFNLSYRRGELYNQGMSGQGNSLVDELYAVAEQSSRRARARMEAEARRSEAQFKRLETASDRAADRVDNASDKLSNLRDAAASVASSVAGAVRRIFDLGSLGKTSQQVTTTRMIDGQAVTTASNQKVNPTAGGIAKSFNVTARAIKAFAEKLTALGKKGYPDRLIREIAELGVEEGTPIADALLKATAAEVKSVSDNYKSINTWSDRAGTAVANISYEKQIKVAEQQLRDAKRNADDIRRQLSRETDRVIRAISTGLRGATGSRKADGGLVTFHANGSVSENHIAQIARAGEYRVWAEDETEGETYVPHARSKRARSEAIMAETARRFGGRYIPASAMGYADGAVVGESASAGQLPPHVTQKITFVNPVTRDLEKDAAKAGRVLGGMVMGGKP